MSTEVSKVATLQINLEHVKSYRFIDFNGWNGGLRGAKKNNVKDIERMLSAAGSKVEYAKTDERLSKLKTLKQHNVVVHGVGGSVYYIFTDVEFCKCLYIDSENAYQNYLSLVAQENTDEMYEDEDDDLYLRAMGIYGRSC